MYPPIETKARSRSARKLLILAGVLAIGYVCIHTLRFSLSLLNYIFVALYLLVPFLAIRPMLRVAGRFRILGWLVLTPLLFVASLRLLMMLVSPVMERYQLLQTTQQGSSTIKLVRFSQGGAVGVKGIYLEQRRPIVPGLYLAKMIDVFDFAKAADLSVVSPLVVKVHARGRYGDNNYVVDETYALKPWVYF